MKDSSWCPVGFAPNSTGAGGGDYTHCCGERCGPWCCEELTQDLIARFSGISSNIGWRETSALPYVWKGSRLASVKGECWRLTFRGNQRTKFSINSVVDSSYDTPSQDCLFVLVRRSHSKRLKISGTTRAN